MTATEHNVSTTKQWIINACKKEEKIFSMLSVNKKNEIMLYQIDGIKKEDLVKQLRHIADAIENPVSKLQLVR